MRPKKNQRHYLFNLPTFKVTVLQDGRLKIWCHRSEGMVSVFYTNTPHPKVTRDMGVWGYYEGGMKYAFCDDDHYYNCVLKETI